MEKNEVGKIQCLLGKKIGLPEIINVLYTALMVFLVFTAGNDLFKGLIGDFHIKLLLYVVLWGSMAIQTIFAYKHIRDVSDNYKSLAFLSDCFDIGLFIYVCAAIGGTYDNITKEFTDLDTYWHISIPFLILSFNQLCWYIFVKEKKKSAAIFRLILLFIVMLTTTILDKTYHNIWMLTTIVGGNFFIMVILRAINKAPRCFVNQIDELPEEPEGDDKKKEEDKTNSNKPQ
jgi:hypothetical protein